MKLSLDEKEFLTELLDRALTHDITIIRWNRQKMTSAPESLRSTLRSEINLAQKRIALAHKTLQKL